jgi:hypothetical protein
VGGVEIEMRELAVGERDTAKNTMKENKDGGSFSMSTDGTIYLSDIRRTSAPSPKRTINRAKPFLGNYFRDFFLLL